MSIGRLSIPDFKSGSSMTVTSVKQFDNQAAFEDQVRSALFQVPEYHEFVFTDVPGSWGEVVFQRIDEEVPSRIDWLLNCDITRAEQLLLHVGVGTTLDFKYGPYSGSKKEPDFFFQVNDHILPTLAVESGWSESYTNLLNDMNLLLVGGNGSIKVVIILKWTKMQGRVSGKVELFTHDRNGIPKLDQTEVVFPRPGNTSSQGLRIRRDDLFGPALLAGRNGNDILELDIERLRDHASRALGFMNLVPA